ncbi:hypothetical protein [Fibrella forsythiae]|uniref:Amidohydrolase n=1 Tax=Fibrella forsythiae TaxID=2817061 RepID=A0ABS3JAS5_9BACT|nr:hypothetical protein [Fibrella forsythiae]MBO0947079.1 hypothetical protein [Fibrella forsythiae]
MRTVALEEHISLPELTSRIPEELIIARGWPAPDSPNSPTKRVGPELREVGEARLKSMDEAGITVQVLAGMPKQLFMCYG